MEHRLVDDEWRQTTSVVTEPQIHGRDEDREKVVEFLLKDAYGREELSVYCIVGHGGYGKTALAQLVFNDERVNTHFPLKIWVCVSDDFNMTKVTLPWFEPPPPEPPDRSCFVLVADKRTIHFESKVVADTPGICNKDAQGHSNVKVILPLCNGVTDTAIPLDVQFYQRWNFHV